MLVAVAAYAVQRFFFHASLWVFFPSIFVAAGFLLTHEYRLAAISAGVAVMAFVYRHAFYESRDVRRPTGTDRKQDPERP